MGLCCVVFNYYVILGFDVFGVDFFWVVVILFVFKVNIMFFNGMV